MLKQKDGNVDIPTGFDVEDYDSWEDAGTPWTKERERELLSLYDEYQDDYSVIRVLMKTKKLPATLKTRREYLHRQNQRAQQRQSQNIVSSQNSQAQSLFPSFPAQWNLPPQSPLPPPAFIPPQSPLPPKFSAN